ncbi:FecR domain-containing protein [Prosthecobacter sp.]|uniref:FecR family protein n=1 Tax=Prosthecobacter sp. TaxID=1965333 RepID=UPI0037840B54
MKLFAALAVFALAGLGFAADASSNGTVSVAVGTVTLLPLGGGAEMALKVGDPVPVGSTVKTGAGARAVIKTTKQSAIRIAENSQAVFMELVDSDTAPKVLVDLKSGSLGALIQPQAQSTMDFKVKTPSGIAAARGTMFAVAVEDGKGFVKVEHGKVDVTPTNVKKQAPQSGKVTIVSGKVTETPPGQPEHALKEGDIVTVGSTLKTGADSHATVTMTTTSAIRLGPDSEAVVAEIVESKDAPKVLVDLKNGTVGALVKPEGSGKMDFKIKTPSGTAVAKGAFYSVSVENGKGYVQTKDGEVVIVPLETAATTTPKAQQ